MGMARAIPSKFEAEWTQGWSVESFNLLAEKRLRRAFSRITHPNFSGQGNPQNGTRKIVYFILRAAHLDVGDD